MGPEQAHLLALELACSFVELRLLVWAWQVFLHCLVNKIVLLTTTLMVSDAV